MFSLEATSLRPGTGTGTSCPAAARAGSTDPGGYVVVSVPSDLTSTARPVWRASIEAAVPGSGAAGGAVLRMARMWLINGLAGPLAAIGLALLMLAWVERHWALLAYTLV
jgi:hypothetical protein